jgi:hypothetical protein
MTSEAVWKLKWVLVFVILLGVPMAVILDTVLR